MLEVPTASGTIGVTRTVVPGITYSPRDSLTYPVRKGDSWQVNKTDTSGAPGATLYYVAFAR